MLVLVSALILAAIARGATITIVNLDSPGEGFNDATAAVPVGGNNGTTIGQQRLVVFQRAAQIWGARLASSVPIRIGANFDPMSCTPTSGTLGSAGPVVVIRDFAGAPRPNTWYAMALANALAGEDLDPDADDIRATFNSNLGSAGCLPTRPWYYGLDGNAPANSIDLLDTILHEFAHGLGFLSTVNLTTGARLNGFNDTFIHNLEDHSTGKTYPQMTDLERKNASTDTGDLHWVGTNVAALSHILASGRGAGDHVEMYAPDPVESGSSVSHFSDALSPDELMEPFATPTSDSRLTVELMKDIGWTVFASGPSVAANSSAIVSESCIVGNGVIDPGETVTVDFSLRNTGSMVTSNLVATLLATGGVSAPSSAQTYGVLDTNGAAVGRTFSFMAAGACGGNLTATLQLQDGTNDFGTVAFTFKLGRTFSFTNSAGISVPSSGPGSPYPSTITVLGQTQTPNGVTVKLFNMSHGNPDDLDILLVGPGGQTVVLMSDTGGNSDLSNVALTFDDTAAGSLPDSSPISSGVFRPTNIGMGDGFPTPAPGGPHGETLSVFNGANPNGTWALYVLDDANPRSGSIAGGWSINFQVCCADTTNLPPFLTLSNAPLSYVENSGAVVIDAAAIVADADSLDLNGGALTVDISTNGTADDRLGIRHQGTGVGQIGVSGDTITFGGSVIGSFTGGSNGTSPLAINFSSVNATPISAQALLKNITFANVSENPSTLARTIRFTLNDGDGGTSQPATKTVNVMALNDAPLLDNSGNPALVSIAEDISNVSNSGTLVLAVIGTSIADVDAPALRGIAVVETDNNNGHWQYSTNAGATWLNFDVVTESAARLLATNAAIRFAPGTNFNGTAAIACRAWDQTTGVNGGTANTSANGGTTAFSTNAENASITVTPVNDPPALAAIDNQTVSEGSTLVVTNVTSDPDVPTNALTFTLLSGPTGAVVNATTGLFTWTPSEIQGPRTNSITLVVSDDGVPGLNATQTFNVVVFEVNEAPVLGAISDRVIHQGTTVTITNSVTDSDAPINAFSFSLSNAPAGASIDAASGIFTWTPDQNQANTTNIISAIVSDDGIPALGDSKSFSITVLSAPVIESITLTDTNLSLIWSAIPGVSYRVQFKASLDESSWNDVPGDVTATETTAMKVDASGIHTQRFYRVVTVP